MEDIHSSRACIIELWGLSPSPPRSLGGGGQGASAEADLLRPRTKTRGPEADLLCPRACARAQGLPFDHQTVAPSALGPGGKLYQTIIYEPPR